MTDLNVSISSIVNAPVEQVFDAWLNPGILAQFILPAPGMAQPQVETDAREGGRFSILMQVGDEEIPHNGSYLALQRPHRLAFTWESPFSSDDSIVTLVFTEIDAGSTRIDLNHVRFINEEARDNHAGGWGNILRELGELLKPACEPA